VGSDDDKGHWIRFDITGGRGGKVSIDLCPECWDLFCQFVNQGQLNLTDEWTWLVDGAYTAAYGYAQGSIFPTYEQAKARKPDAAILHSQRTPWTRVDGPPK
jgi:hypothetical protein